MFHVSSIEYPQLHQGNMVLQGEGDHADHLKTALKIHSIHKLGQIHSIKHTGSHICWHVLLFRLLLKFGSFAFCNLNTARTVLPIKLQDRSGKHLAIRRPGCCHTLNIPWYIVTFRLLTCTLHLSMHNGTVWASGCHSMPCRCFLQ